MEIYNYYGKSKVHSISNKGPYNFHSMDFENVRQCFPFPRGASNLGENTALGIN
jgi:hypothetical protein